MQITTMKTLQKTLAMAATVLAVAANADVSVEDVKCTPRYPWNGLVDIEYTIGCDDPEAEIYVNPVGFNGDTGLTVFPTHFTGDGATNTVKAGKHTMVWDAKADLGNLFSSKNFQIKMYAGKKLSRYIVIDISGGTNATEYAIRHSIEGPNLADDTCRTTEIWMRLIPPGTFMMGSPEDELGRSDNEDLHKVTLTKPFYMGVFEVTQRQWELVMGERPSYFRSNYEVRPVERISWRVIRGYWGDFAPNSQNVGGGSFLGKLRLRTKNTGFDLPSEAQWEYTCRAGGVTPFNADSRGLADTFGAPFLNSIAQYYGNSGANASYNETSLNTTIKVGSLLPNKLGLYDMHGNVDEWCRDSYNEHLGPYEMTDPIDITNWSSHSVRIYRGGSWVAFANGIRSAQRYRNTDGFCQNCTGMRLCCSAEAL